MGAEKSDRSFPALASSPSHWRGDGGSACTRVDLRFLLPHSHHGHFILRFADIAAWSRLLPGVERNRRACVALSDMLTWYTTTFKDSLVAGREPWFMSSLYFETFPQLFFFPVAAYAFWK
ncbi:hypothetical protein Chor_005910, partial [Crotalus horridus]